MKKLMTIFAVLTMVFGFAGIATAVGTVPGTDVDACDNCGDYEYIERGCVESQEDCLPFDFETPSDYCEYPTKGYERNRAIFRICDCIPEVWDTIVEGDTIDISMEILVDSGSGMTVGDNGVYWAEDIDSSAGNGIPMGTYDTQIDACEGKGYPKSFDGKFDFFDADDERGYPYTYTGLDDDCDGPGEGGDDWRVVRFEPASGQVDGNHGYVVKTEDELKGNSTWAIDIPEMRIDNDMIAGGEKVYVRICLTLDCEGICSEDITCCCIIYIGDLCCPEDLTPDEMTIIYPYGTDAGDWWFGATLTNTSSTAGNAVLTMYENDGDISSGAVVVPANSNAIWTLADIINALELDTSVEGTIGNSPFYLTARAVDFNATGFAMIGNTVTGNSMGYLAIPSQRVKP